MVAHYNVESLLWHNKIIRVMCKAVEKEVYIIKERKTLIYIYIYIYNYYYYYYFFLLLFLFFLFFY